MNIISPETGARKLNKNILIVLGGAVLAAVLVAVLVQVTLSGNKKPAVVEADASLVLVAARDLKTGDELREGDMRWQEWPEGNLFRGAILRKGDEPADEALTGRLERSFSEGEAMVRSGILTETTQNFVLARLQPGERAVSIKVKAEGMVAGFINPGSYVDVILTYRQRVNIDDDSPQVQEMVQLNISNVATETILERVRVLAVDQKAEVKEDDKIKVGKTVTLAVGIRDAEKLALASELGEITLAMRGLGDDAPNEKAKAVSDARLTSIADEIYEEYEKLRSESNTGINANRVKIYNGAEIINIPVK